MRSCVRLALPNSNASLLNLRWQTWPFLADLPREEIHNSLKAQSQGTVTNRQQLPNSLCKKLSQFLLSPGPSYSTVLGDGSFSRPSAEHSSVFPHSAASVFLSDSCRLQAELSQLQATGTTTGFTCSTEGWQQFSPSLACTFR